MAIGYNYDMSSVAPDAIITSVVLYWEALYIRIVESIIDGTFTPQANFYGLAEGAIDITPLNGALAPPGAEAAVLAARQRILHEGFNVFDNILETNDGRRVGEDGKAFSDDVILGGINWYYRNVVEL